MDALPEGMRARIGVVALCVPWAAAVVASGAGVAAWLTGLPIPVAAAVGGAFALYGWTLLRLFVAGGGTAPHVDLPSAPPWKPRPLALGLLLFLSVMAAQPLMLLALGPQHDAIIHRHRTTLVTMHEQAALEPIRDRLCDAATVRDDVAARLGAVQRKLASAQAELPGLLADDNRGHMAARQLEARVVAGAIVELEDSLAGLRAQEAAVAARVAALEAEEKRIRTVDLGPYTAAMNRSHFMVQRVRLAWTSPDVAASWTLLFILLAVGPLWLALRVARTALQLQDLERWTRMRALVDAEHAAMSAEELRLLSAWPTFGGAVFQRWEDAPYNQRLRPVRAREVLPVGREQLLQWVRARRAHG